MFGFFIKRALKENMKIVAQNYSALQYCKNFMAEIDAHHMNKILIDVNRDWKPGTKLTHDQLEQMFKMNWDLRGIYDASLARIFDRKAFDEEFKPLLGWDEYFSRYL